MNSIEIPAHEQVSTMLGISKPLLSTLSTQPLSSKGFSAEARPAWTCKIIDLVKYPLHFFVHFIQSIFATRSTTANTAMVVIVRAEDATKYQPQNSMTHP